MGTVRDSGDTAVTPLQEGLTHVADEEQGPDRCGNT